MKVLLRLGARIGNAGSDPSDFEQVRLLKRIWIITLAAAIPFTAGMAMTYQLLGQGLHALFWLIQTLIWLGSLSLYAVLSGKIESYALSSQILLILSSFVATCLLGGFFQSDGAIFLGLIGVLYAMVFPNRKRAIILFVAYLILFAAALVLELTSFRSDSPRPPVSTLFFWLTFATVAAFTVLAIYYFVGQRDLGTRLLQAEKDRSEGLLKRIEKDLELAARIQKDFLPRHDPRMELFEISGANVSCYEVGGDYYDFVPIDSHRLGIAVGDVSGKGIGAALLMASLRAAFQAEIHPGYRIEHMAARINDFVHHSSALSSFITFFFCQIDRESDELLYVNAGHNPPLVLRADGTEERLASSGFCLGMFAGSVYEVKSIRLQAGDVVVLYTDGIPDCRDADEAEYSMERMAALLRLTARESAAAIVAAVTADVKSFIGRARQFDDQTLVVIKRT